jgi:hypothetical protein
MGEPKEVERVAPRARVISVSRFVTRLANAPLRGPEVQEAALYWMDRQTVFGHPLRQNIHHPPRVGFVLEDDHEVVRVTDQVRLAAQTTLHFPLEPVVQHIVQEDVTLLADPHHEIDPW